MAKKKRRMRARTTRRVSYKKVRRKSKSQSGLMNTIIASMAYGASRKYVSDKLAPITSKVPLGQYSDEAVMMATNYLVAKGKIPVLSKVPMLRQVAKSGLMIESAMIGEQLASRMTTGQSMTTSSGNLW